ncbi:hypothetical protein Zm00014a_004685 [Zea mays]|uniref:Uncharacterized protein n=1 Tax=Zea mays TaxID=4577 RepID=A0A3L6FYR0_MAIZE|nr:hypothetical protein Zm00014a_004685 [Zea mays]
MEMEGIHGRGIHLLFKIE